MVNRIKQNLHKYMEDFLMKEKLLTLILLVTLLAGCAGGGAGSGTIKIGGT